MFCKMIIQFFMFVLFIYHCHSYECGVDHSCHCYRTVMACYNVGLHSVSPYIMMNTYIEISHLNLMNNNINFIFNGDDLILSAGIIDIRRQFGADCVKDMRTIRNPGVQVLGLCHVS